MSRIEILAVERAALLNRIEALEEKHKIREYNVVKGKIERQLSTLDREAQGLGFKFRQDPHTDCGGALVSDTEDKDYCLKCGKSGRIYSNDDKQGVMRYRFKEEWDEKGGWNKW
jgi:hypothetical protein